MTPCARACIESAVRTDARQAERLQRALGGLLAAAA
jgi:hypothetical protein